MMDWDAFRIWAEDLISLAPKKGEIVMPATTSETGPAQMDARERSQHLATSALATSFRNSMDEFTMSMALAGLIRQTFNLGTILDDRTHQVVGLEAKLHDAEDGMRLMNNSHMDRIKRIEELKENFSIAKGTMNAMQKEILQGSKALHSVLGKAVSEYDLIFGIVFTGQLDELLRTHHVTQAAQVMAENLNTHLEFAIGIVSQRLTHLKFMDLPDEIRLFVEETGAIHDEDFGVEFWYVPVSLDDDPDEIADVPYLQAFNDGAWHHFNISEPRRVGCQIGYGYYRCVGVFPTLREMDFNEPDHSNVIDRSLWEF